MAETMRASALPAPRGGSPWRPSGSKASVAGSATRRSGNPAISSASSAPLNATAVAEVIPSSHSDAEDDKAPASAPPSAGCSNVSRRTARTVCSTAVAASSGNPASTPGSSASAPGTFVFARARWEGAEASRAEASRAAPPGSGVPQLTCVLHARSRETTGGRVCFVRLGGDRDRDGNSDGISDSTPMMLRKHASTRPSSQKVEPGADHWRRAFALGSVRSSRESATVTSSEVALPASGCSSAYLQRSAACPDLAKAVGYSIGSIGPVGSDGAERTIGPTVTVGVTVGEFIASTTRAPPAPTQRLRLNSRCRTIAHRLSSAGKHRAHRGQRAPRFRDVREVDVCQAHAQAHVRFNLAVFTPSTPELAVRSGESLQRFQRLQNAAGALALAGKAADDNKAGAPALDEPPGCEDSVLANHVARHHVGAVRCTHRLAAREGHRRRRALN
eukprot:1189836-Prorocentrum_minimum.AAC.2